MASQGGQQGAFLLPQLQLIGAQKAGTSAVADWLFENKYSRPHVFPGEPHYYSKEVHFFDDESRYSKGLEFYSKRFNPTNCTMDATPDTLPYAKRVRATYEAAGREQLESMKIIVILRNPIFRELSLYNHLAFDCRRLASEERTPWHNQVLKEDGSIMSFDDFVSKRSIPSLGRKKGLGKSTRHSMYSKHLKEWFELFHREQILVLSYDELLSSPRDVQDRIGAFIGEEIPGSLQHTNANNSQYKVKRISAEAYRTLHDAFEPLNESLYQLLTQNPGPPMEQRPFPRFHIRLENTKTGT